PLVMRSSCWVEPRFTSHAVALSLVTRIEIRGCSPAAYVFLSVTGSRRRSSGSHAETSAFGELDGDATGSVGGALATGSSPRPGWKMMSRMIVMTAMRPRPTTRRRRQYTLAGCGPTGFMIVDMAQG